MPAIEHLLHRQGPVRELLGILDDGRVLDLSGLKWSSAGIVNGVIFQRVRIANTRFRPDLVECVLEDSVFSGIRSEHHFSGAGNLWRNCVFQDLNALGLIAPQNRFLDCQFENLTLRGPVLCQTYFENCSFVGCTIQGMSTARVGDKTKQLPDLVKSGGTVLFRDCVFKRSLFNGCSFSHVVFEDCQLDETRCIECDFRDAFGRDAWLKQMESGDPFKMFLREILHGVEQRLGRESQAYRALAEYAEGYLSGENPSKDYSACLFTGEVPDDELDAIETVFDEAEYTFSGGFF